MTSYINKFKGKKNKNNNNNNVSHDQLFKNYNKMWEKLIV